MPTFYADEIDLEPDEYVSACSHWEIEKLIKALIEDGHIKSPNVNKINNISINEEAFVESLDKIANNYVRLTLEEEEFIHNLAKKL